MGIVSTKRDRRNALVAGAKRIAMVLLLGVLIVAALYLYDYLTTAEALAIAQVELRGVTRIDDGDLRRMLADLEGQNILLASLELYEKRLEMHPRVEGATMRRIIPDKVRCDVREREPVALVFTDRFLEIDRHGMVMEDDDYTPLLDLPIITGVSNEDVQAGKICRAESVRGALEVLRVARELGNEDALDISELHVDASGVVVRSLENDCVLLLGDGDYESRLRKFFLLQDALERDGTAPRRVVDLRFEDQVVLRGSI